MSLGPFELVANNTSGGDTRSLRGFLKPLR